MALAKSTNSYVTVEEADAYFADRLDVVAWTDASETQKAQSLVTATSILDELNWTGYAVSEDQLLAFPRYGDYFDPKLGMTVTLGDEVPQRIIKSTYELAYHLLNNDGLLDDTGGVTDIEVGPIKLKNVKSVSMIPGVVYNMIRPLRSIGGAGSRTVWRAN
jgi:hypothetical protein